ncbi:hypothetical protein BROC_02285 [Candidatus Brocadiaceae bacterium]|nr:hypothetical protein BROC_02285 [Candidatus Brocadiaceae bacterium]
MIEAQLQNGTIKSRILHLIKDAGFYGIATAIVSLVNLLSVPLLTRYLSSEEYGTFELVLAYTSLATVIAAVGQSTAFARFSFEADEHERRGAILINCIAIQVVASIIVMALLIALGLSVRPYFQNVDNYPFIVLLVLLAIPALVGVDFARNYLKWTFRQRFYIALSFIYAAMILCGYFMFVYIFRLGLIGAVATQCVSALLVFIVLVWSSRKLNIRKIEAATSRPLVFFGLSYMALGIMNQGIRTVDKTIISTVVGIDAVGIYAVGFKIASIILIIESIFHMSWGPISMAIYKQSNSLATYNAALNLMAVLMAGSIFLLNVFSSTIISYAAPTRFFEGGAIIWILGVGFCFQALAGITGIGIDLSKKSYYLLLSWFVGMAFAAVLMYLLGRRFGITGVAIGFSVGMITEGTIRTFISTRIYPVKFQYSFAIIFILAALLASFAIKLANVPNVVKIGLSILSVLLLASSGIIYFKKQFNHFLNDDGHV